MKSTTILLLSVLFFAVSCKDDEDNPWGLPNATESGANTFGCLINGEPWVAEIGSEVISPLVYKLRMDYDESGYGENYNNTWTTRANIVTDSTSDLFTFTAYKFTSSVNLSVDLNQLDVRFYSLFNQPYYSYRLDENQPYIVEITKLDTDENICSGVFEFFLLSDNRLDTLHITEGRFDKKYDPY